MEREFTEPAVTRSRAGERVRLGTTECPTARAGGCDQNRRTAAKERLGDKSQQPKGAVNSAGGLPDPGNPTPPRGVLPRHLLIRNWRDGSVRLRRASSQAPITEKAV